MVEKILLCSMPFGALDRQALGLSTLKPQLVDLGVSCEVRYLTFDFADLIGVDDYLWMVNEAPYTAFAGDWCFTAALYGKDQRAEERYIREILQDTWRLDESDIRRIRRARSMVAPFLDYCMAANQWSKYAVVGFTSTFEQNIASLALAKRIKTAHPRVQIVFGGGNWEDEMGIELHRRFSFVDLVFQGEADLSFPAWIESSFSGRRTRRDTAKIPGVVFRSNGRSMFTGPPERISEMDKLPIPDYTDYFRSFEESSATSAVVPSLLFEGSRGCWWGAKSQCTFCGLNGNTIAFRTKGAERSLLEIKGQVNRWGIDMIQAVDNILDMRAFRDFIPELANLDRPLQFFYEIKANLTRAQVRMLSKAGVRSVQPGIESMSDRVLALMRKGTNAMQNVQLLKWCREEGVRAQWNILYGVPGETREDYARMLELLRQLRFLDPPTACGPIRLDRFSPYFIDPKKYGLTNVRPLAPYKHLYPFATESLQRIAYYFEYDYKDGRDAAAAAAEVAAFVDDWQKKPETGALRAIERRDGETVIMDDRAESLKPITTLRGLDRAVYKYCNQARTPRAICNLVNKVRPEKKLSEQEVRDFLDSLVEHRLMVSDKKRYLSLALAGSADNTTAIADGEPLDPGKDHLDGY